jgi:hypothetical protein
MDIWYTNWFSCYIFFKGCHKGSTFLLEYIGELRIIVLIEKKESRSPSPPNTHTPTHTLDRAVEGC